MPVKKLPRKIFVFRNNAARFLNGLTANEMDQPQNAFVNIHGRIVTVFDQIKVSDDEVWIVVPESVVERLFYHLDKYLRLGGVRYEEKDLNVYFDPNNDIREGHVVPQKAGQLVLTERDLPDDISEEEFTLFRVKSGIPFQGEDFDEDFLLNVSMKDYVSFTKGCFLGQEPISKVYNRSRPSWRLEVKSEEECLEEERNKMTSRVRDPETGKTVGFVFVRSTDPAH